MRFPSKAKSAISILLVTLHVGSAHADEQSFKDEIEFAIRAAIAVGDDPEACRSTIGKETALTLVRYCRAVSQATHPPCNTGNHCALIVKEINRNCRPMAGDPLPCSDWVQPKDWKGISKRAAQ